MNSVIASGGGGGNGGPGISPAKTGTANRHTRTMV